MKEQFRTVTDITTYLTECLDCMELVAGVPVVHPELRAGNQDCIEMMRATVSAIQRRQTSPKDASDFVFITANAHSIMVNELMYKDRIGMQYAHGFAMVARQLMEAISREVWGL